MEHSALYWLFKGGIIGISISATIGPNALLCLRRTIVLGRTIGLISGLGSACGLAVLASISIVSSSLMTTLFAARQHWLQGITGTIVIGFGICILRSRISTLHSTTSAASWPKYFGSIFILDALSPLSLSLFTSMLSSMGVSLATHKTILPFLIAGIPIGATLWWLVITTILGSIRQQLSMVLIQWMNNVAGIALLVFGITRLLH